MQILTEILRSLPDGEVRDVRLGLHWTAVVVETGGVLRCGLSATLFVPHGHDQGPDILVPGLGCLQCAQGGKGGLAQGHIDPEKTAEFPYPVYLRRIVQ